MTGDTPGEPGEESRRGVLRALGVGVVGTGAIGGVAGTGAFGSAAGRGPAKGGQNGTTATNATNATGGPAGRGPTTVVLGAETAGWLGLAPDAIEGVRNPALALRPGGTYRVVWVNLDGERHRFRALDGSDEPVAGTDPAGSVGATRAVTFDATEAVAAYRCRFHPERMRGEIRLREDGLRRRAGNETVGNRTGGNRTAENGTAGNRTTGNGTAGNGTAPPADGGAAEVAVGPEGSYFRFVPEEVTVPVGGTVRWTAESVGHNVSGRPGDSDAVELPDGAEPFSSYPPGESYAILEVGATYEHTFETPGEYVYVCLPHVSEGMVATVRVTGREPQAGGPSGAFVRPEGRFD